VGAHDDTIDSVLAQKGEDLLGGHPGANHDLAVDAKVFGALDERFIAALFGAQPGIVVVIGRGVLGRGSVGLSQE
jgi:hypothetical protein